ncbi:tRNA adenosine(34) deaminase TadA [Buchnera aphidicola (Mollitrichosiphum nigrofasciatum)]
MCQNEIDEYWMNYALKFAKENYLNYEIPIGAILILNNKIIGFGTNLSTKNNDPTAHAEILALRQGGSYIKNYRLLETTLYVTLEPCIMCLGAIAHSRIKRLVIGAISKKILNFQLCKLCKYYKIYDVLFSKVIVKKMVFKKKCSFLLKNFFKKKR